MKSLLALWYELAEDFSEWCHVSTVRDCKTVADRVESEGISFLTITLANFCVDFEEALAKTQVTPTHFAGFRRRGGLPLFLRGFLELIFDSKTGSMLAVPDKNAVYAVRQLCRFYSKIGIDCSDLRKEKAFEAYIKCENEIQKAESEWTVKDLDEFSRVSRILFAGVLNQLDADVAYQRLVPKHGPGSTADRLLGNQKYNQRVWHRRLESVFSMTDYLIPNPRYHHILDSVDLVEPEDELPVRVIDVPKTLKTPRIIAMEPTCMMYAQQAIAQPLMRRIQNDSRLGRVIGFFDQEPNKALARRGSVDGSLATLDLSEASDRVSNRLVKAMLSNHPHLRDAVMAARSTRADVPGHGVIPLSKFASMGSALCFPFEAMVFLTIVMMGIQSAHRAPLDKSRLLKLVGQVRIFGDDIIVPTDYALSVMTQLEYYGLRVNKRKSYWTGKFRESCGGDYFDGTDVTPIRIKKVLPSSRRDAEEIVSTVALRNHLYKKGLWHSADYLDNILHTILKGKYPVVGEKSPVLGRISISGSEPERLSPTTYSPQVRGYVVDPKHRVNSLDDVGALMKYFLNSGNLQVTDRLHLIHSGRPVAVDIKLRWAPSD